MASFNTVSDAVNAAIKIQQTCNASKEFQLRIGIHLGEVIFENDDVFGDGVNIASRIQAIANPGSVYISESVHNSISNKKEFQSKFFTEQRLKNVKEPIKIYQVIADGVVVAHQQVVQRMKPKRNVVLLLVSLVIILIATYFFKGGLVKLTNDKVTSAGGRSLAVLPFENLSRDTTQEYFSDGMTESIYTDLAQIPGLFVLSRSSVAQFKGRDINPAEIGNLFNVRYILQGKVQHAGERLRINAYLTDTQDGRQVWAQNFNGKMEDIFSVQDSISDQIINALRIAIGKENSVHTRSTENMEAYDYFLRAEYISNANRANSRKMLDSSIILYEKAIALDPQFALAYAAVARNYTAIYFIHDKDQKWESKAFVAIEKSLSLDPKLAEAYAAKGNLSWTLSNGFPHEKAITELKQAIQLNANLVDAHETLGAIYFHIGMLEAALGEFRIVLSLDPGSRFTRPRVARIYWYQQKFDSALAAFSAITDLSPGWKREEALTLWYLGKKEAAFEILDEQQKITETGSDKTDFAATYAVFLAGTGKKKEAEENIKFAVAHGQGLSHFHHAEHLIASAYALMGNADSAVVWLQKTADHGLPCYPLFKNDPNLKSLKNDPGYISLMDKLKKQWEYYMKNL